MKTIIITNIYTHDGYFYIISNKNIFKSPILNGSVTFKIFSIINSKKNNKKIKKELYLYDLNISDKINIYYDEYNNIIKIIIFNDYELNKDS